MINLGSLSALIRTLRHTTGIDGPAAPVARVASIAPVAEDDAGAMTPTAVRSPLHSRTAIPLEIAEVADTDRRSVRDESSVRDAALVRAAGTNGPRDAATMSASRDGTPNVALELTALARLLHSVLKGAPHGRPTAPTVTSASPLGLDVHAPAAPIAEALSRAIAESGLFYESHLARVLQRDYSMAAVSREPQAAWPTSTGDGAATATATSLPEPAGALLSRQLDALDTRSVVWVGDVWPGRPATIRFEQLEDRADTAANDADAEVAPSSWQTRIVIELPALGRITATVALHGQSLDVMLGVPTAETADRVDAAREALLMALGGAQLGLRSLVVTVER